MYNDGRDYDVLMEARVVLLTFECLPYRVRSPYHFHYSHTRTQYTYVRYITYTSTHHAYAPMSDATDVYHHRLMDGSTNEYLAGFAGTTMRKRAEWKCSIMREWRSGNLMKKIDAYLWHVDGDLGNRRSSLTSLSGGVSQFSKVLPSPSPSMYIYIQINTLQL